MTAADLIVQAHPDRKHDNGVALVRTQAGRDP
jgi:hypothetical protein